jgi:hypothetical protein
MIDIHSWKNNNEVPLSCKWWIPYWNKKSPEYVTVEPLHDWNGRLIITLESEKVEFTQAAVEFDQAARTKGKGKDKGGKDKGKGKNKGYSQSGSGRSMYRSKSN